MKIVVEVIKHSGERSQFSIDKLKSSLRKSGADEALVAEIANNVRDELYQGISTKEIYNRAFALLKKKKRGYASKYKLKKAIYELGPTGFPFEKFVAAILFYSGYEVRIGQFLQGKCVTHEVDVVAHNNGIYVVAECKFHSDEGRNCNVKIPLYIHSRYRDILNFYGDENNGDKPNEGWVVTNTRFTEDAIKYGTCVGLYLLSWDYPKNNGIKDRIDRLGLYPVTVSTLLSKREKQFLLSRDVVLCKQLIDDHFYLDHLGVSDNRKVRILEEINILCQNH
ncbi:ATP cone domain-containing protein [Aequorivita marisscotiae]|uniref:ATP cone domain-containing protein n=1 Tax=Aequorivita marisscotiae TaxID=3040348 RepID=A0ABY8L066_9FLAO|nr:ATP cone domain-containing protein [Aequorivita sp. Ant34-E75]WGF94149.1 ATP cone domain-containing protein [Aequorivita sp. Ant34-E75]